MNNQILLIDDDVDLLDSFAESITLSGHTVITSYSAKEGIELYRKHSPCIVFSDIKMPDMDGYELFSKIKEIDPLAKVILISGYPDKKKSIIAKNNGLVHIMDKPIITSQLSEMIKKNNC